MSGFPQHMYMLVLNKEFRKKNMIHPVKVKHDHENDEQ